MFKKYHSIENSYNAKWVNYFLDSHPQLRNEEYVLLEKVDGSNFQVFISKHEICFGKRSSFLGETESFFNWQNVVAKYMPYFKEIQEKSQYIHNGQTIRLFGELFGPGIQKRVNYGPEKDLRFFDVAVDDEIISYVRQTLFFSEFAMSHLMVPFLAKVSSLKEAMEYNEVFRSLLTPENYDKENFSEGFIIKPYNKVVVKNNGELFILKKKNEKFKENDVIGKPKPEEMSKEDRSLNHLFISYLNENRVLSVYSKEGIITDKKQIGKYIKLVLEDAKTDFMKDHGEKLNGLEDKAIDQIFNRDSGKVILSFLMETINKPDSEVIN